MTSQHASAISGNKASQRTFAFRRAEKQAKATPDLYRLLDDAEWHTRKEIMQRLQIDSRTIRLIVEASRGEILSGANGYKLTLKASVEEVTGAVLRMKKGIDSTGKHISDILKVKGMGKVA